MFICAGVAMLAFAGVPEVMSFQGRLTDDSDNPLNGSYSLTFKLYDVSAGGTALWSETHENVPVTDGLFSVLIGESGGLTDAEFEGSERYLGITVEDDPEISPRTQIGAVGFAYRVATIDSATGGTITGEILLKSQAGVNAMEIDQTGLGRGLRIGMNNAGSSEAGLSIASQNSGPAIQIVPDGGGPAIDVIGSFGDASVNLPNGSISGFELEDGTVDNADLANNAVSSAKIENGTITTSDISDGTIQNQDIAPDEVNSDRLENEPGVAQDHTFATFAAGLGYTSPIAVTLNAPTSGYALVMVSATGVCIHNTGDDNILRFGLSEFGNSLDDDQQKQWLIPASVPTGTQRTSLASQKIFPASSGSNTYYLTILDDDGPSPKSVTDITISAVFFPTVYGEYEE
jgi:hypothetical protein